MMSGIKCAKCGGPLGSGHRFCGACGAPVSGQPVTAEGCWDRRPGEIAVRIESERKRFWGREELRVNDGTKALLLSAGELVTELVPGSYTDRRLKQLIGDVPSEVSLIVYDAGDISLELAVRDVFTADPVRLDVDCQVVVRVDDARLFTTNELKSRDLYTETDLRGLLYEELHNGFQEHLSARRADELSSDLDHKHEVEVSLARHLGETLRRDGLEVIQLRTIRYRHERLDRQRGKKEEIVLATADAEIDLDGRQRRFDALSRDEQQSIIEASAEAERAFERNRVRSRLREALGADRMDELRAKDGLEAFELEMGKAGMLRDDERETLSRTLEEKKGDAEMARTHLVNKLELEQGLELDRIRRISELDLDIEEAEKRAEAEKRIGDLQHTAGLEREAKEMAQNRKEAEWGVEMLRKMKAVKREEADADVDRELRAERSRVEIEAERLRALSEASIEALIATSGGEQAKMLAELKRTETLSALSEDQILAMAAENSPEVAKAFQERFRGLGADKITELYERMLSDRDSAMGALRATQSEAIGAMRDVGVAGAGRQDAVVGPGGVVMSGKVLVCSRCRVEVPVGQKHCSNCGAEMF